MLLEDILSSSKFSLPHEIVESDDFLTHLSFFLKEYYDDISKSKGVDASFKRGGLSKKVFLDDLNGIITGIINGLNEYLRGFPAKAYSEFDAFLDDSDLITYLSNTKKIRLSRKSLLYRIRADKYVGSKPAPLSLFHIPFELRRRVATQRYSIPGFPSLYLANSMEVAWRELNKPLIKKIKAIAFQNLRSLTLLDLVPMNIDDWKKRKVVASTNSEKIKIEQELYYYALSWPLVAACHLKIKYSENPAFKSEYIMPQLLLQWLVQNYPIIDGIRYFSSKAYFETGKINHYFNYVIPVKDINASGYCSNLLHLFLKSSVIEADSLKFKLYRGKTKEERMLLKLSAIEARLGSAPFSPF